MTEERRQSVRIASKLTTFIKFPQTGKVVRGLTNDLSGVGIGFTAQGAFEPGDPLEIELTLPDRTVPIRFMAEVVWSIVEHAGQHAQEPSLGVGVKFVSIDPKDRTAIMQYARLNATPPGP